jgi:hypothetical protein
MSFTEESTAAIQQIFERASAMQPTGHASIGELETTVLTQMCEEWAGGDAQETAIQLYLRRFKDENGCWQDGECYYSMNGINFHILLTNYVHDNWMIKVAADEGPTRCGEWTIFDVDEITEIEPALRKAFQLMEDNILCPGCKKNLSLGTDFGICSMCTTTWNTVPCVKCRCHFGVLTDGIHVHCQ